MQVTAASNTYHVYAPQSRSPAAAAPNKPQPSANAETNGELSQEQRQLVEKLKARDREVRAHEQAHLSAAGNLAVSGANYDYVTGPDGQRYASGGDVSIDVSAVAGDPQATLLKADTIRRAALAPANPSAQDQSVAARATAMANKARAELLSLQGSANGGTTIDLSA
ncbi:putative metalloprotease CJM1_0395 family protein [Methylomonas sp. EFPC3]|uniref:putative metalloprotease CJM1_0395 family protein n=1 Tax=Methylomonas sp. EFPC3 TaxID=3021710 RepID=UPI00241745DC|nr:putative metalloprotease CJM1_0395 family protein [Methylomonas sp. EFPC3]WFP50889.1 putative metalloprotease CJM1_0395 family protein [Methylomonas sp. EFPC3]